MDLWATEKKNTAENPIPEISLENYDFERKHSRDRKFSHETLSGVSSINCYARVEISIFFRNMVDLIFFIIFWYIFCAFLPILTHLDIFFGEMKIHNT